MALGIVVSFFCFIMGDTIYCLSYVYGDWWCLCRFLLCFFCFCFVCFHFGYILQVTQQTQTVFKQSKDENNIHTKKNKMKNKIKNKIRMVFCVMGRWWIRKETWQNCNRIILFPCLGFFLEVQCLLIVFSFFFFLLGTFFFHNDPFFFCGLFVPVFMVLCKTFCKDWLPRTTYITNVHKNTLTMLKQKIKTKIKSAQNVKNKTKKWNEKKRTTIYHLGTIAFASLLVAIIEFTEWVLTYLEKKFTTEEKSPLQKFVLCLVHCCLRCLKCVLDKINRTGIVITTVYGWPFCAASMTGIGLIFRNILRATALSMVSGYLEILGKISITAINTGLMVLITNYAVGDEISSLVVPGIVEFFFLRSFFFVCFCFFFVSLVISPLFWGFLCFLFCFLHTNDFVKLFFFKHICVLSWVCVFFWVCVCGFIEKVNKVLIFYFFVCLCVLFKKKVIRPLRCIKNTNETHANTNTNTHTHKKKKQIYVLVSFAVAFQYMQLFEVGIQTIFICFLIDEKHNKTSGYMRASKKLRELINAKPPKSVQRELKKS